MVRRRKPALCAVLLAGCGDTVCSTTTTSKTVTGQILDAGSNAPVPGVTVQLLDLSFKPYSSAAALARFGS